MGTSERIWNKKTGQMYLAAVNPVGVTAQGCSRANKKRSFQGKEMNSRALN